MRKLALVGALWGACLLSHAPAAAGSKHREVDVSATGAATFLSSDELDGNFDSEKGNDPIAAAPLNIGGLAAFATPMLQPILKPNSVFQLPEATEPRSMSLGAKRRVIYITDGKLHNKVDVPWWQFWASAPEPFPYGYIMKPSGEMFLKLLFKGRTLQPYGIAEGEDGRVAVTFYQGPQLEVWEDDLSMAWSFNEQSIHPTLPFFLPKAVTGALGYPTGTLAVPFDIMDVMNDKDAGTVQLWLYHKDAGRRVELFRRRQFSGMNLPHSAAIIVSKPTGAKNKPTGYLYAAGLQEWIWEEGRGRGMWLVRDKWRNETSPVRLNVYQMVNDRSAPEIVDETAARWKQDNPDKPQPRGAAEIAPYTPQLGLRKVASYHFSGVCRWPLFSLVQAGSVQYAVTGCYDDAWVEVLRLSDDRGVLLPAAESVSYVKRPFGISRLGAISADPVTGTTVALLDRGRKRVYSAPFPFPPGRHEQEQRTAAEAAVAPILGDGEGLHTVNAAIPLP